MLNREIIAVLCCGPYETLSNIRLLNLVVQRVTTGISKVNSLAQRCRLQSQYGGTRRRTGGEVNGKMASGVGSQYSCSLPRNMVYPALLPLMRTHRLPVVDWTDAPADLNGLVRFTERRNLVSAGVPSHFNWPLQRWYEGSDSPFTNHPLTAS